MAFTSEIVGLLAFACLAAFSNGQRYYSLLPGFCTTARTDELFPHPTDCSAYLQCGDGLPQPFIKQCARGTLFDPVTKSCQDARNVNCAPHPGVYSGVYPYFPLHPLAPAVYAAPYAAGTNRPVVNLFDVVTGPVVTPDQCREINRQVNVNLRAATNQINPICAGNPTCQTSLPVITLRCNTPSGRV